MKRLRNILLFTVLAVFIASLLLNVYVMAAEREVEFTIPACSS